MQELQGVIDNIVFQSEDNQFSVFRVKTDHEGKVRSEERRVGKECRL